MARILEILRSVVWFG